MNCQEFEGDIEVLARGALADACARAEALSHEESCAACAARLANERALSMGLRALASSMKDAEPAARVESALLTAFRARAGSVAVVVEAVSNADDIDNVVPLSAQSKSEHWSWVKTLAVAGLAAAAALALFVLVRPGATVPTKNAGMVAGTPAGSKEQSKEQTAAQGNAGGESAPSVAQNHFVSGDRDEHPATAPDDGVDKIARASSTRRPAGRAPRPSNVSFNAGGALNSQDAREDAAATEGSDAQQEIATDFIPLMQGARYAQAEGGHLVRVELPRSALASFGLPVNAEAAFGRVKADVLLGDDGLARAIRFVR
jgi:hypothetical protein